MTRALVDDVTVLGLDEDGRAVLPDLTHLVAGAALADLASSGRIDRPVRPVVVTDARPVQHPVLDPFLERIAGTRRGKSATRWVLDSGRSLAHAECAHLARTGILRSSEAPVLGLFPRTRYGVADTATRTVLLDRLRWILLHEDPPTATDHQDMMLLSLIGAASHPRRTAAAIAPELDAADLRARLGRVALDHWVVAATARAVRLAHAARA